MDLQDKLWRLLFLEDLIKKSPNKMIELFHDGHEYEWALVKKGIETEDENPINELYYILLEKYSCEHTIDKAVRSSAELTRAIYDLCADVAAPCAWRS